MRFVYPANLTPDETDGGFVVTFRDLPEAITQGDTREAALLEAADCLEEAIAARIDEEMEIPPPSALLSGECAVSVPVQTAMKAALYVAIQALGISQSELARRLAVDEQEARRLLDPRHASKTASLEHALVALGRHCVVDVLEAA